MSAPGSSVCPNLNANLTKAQVDQTFGKEPLTDGIQSLFSGGPVLNRVPATGRLTETSLEAIYNNLTSGNPPRLLSNKDYKDGMKPENIRSTLEGLGLREKKTMEDIQKEFCFNFVRYQWSLNQLFDKLVETSKQSALTDTQRNEINGLLDQAKTFNEKLNDIIQVTNFIAKKRAEDMATQNSEINGLNANINSLFSNLNKSNDVLRKEDALLQLRKRMVEYSQEKNASASNLLGLYGFLNLVALGLLFYISQK